MYNKYELEMVIHYNKGNKMRKELKDILLSGVDTLEKLSAKVNKRLITYDIETSHIYKDEEVSDFEKSYTLQVRQDIEGVESIEFSKYKYDETSPKILEIIIRIQQDKYIKLTAYTYAELKEMIKEWL